jgi:hypothetical protein
MADPAAPSDLDGVRSAFRLGWGVAELRGRYRPDLFDQPEPGAPPPSGRKDHALPLANERKSREVRIEVFEAVSGLSKALKLDLHVGGAPALERLQGLFEQIEDGQAGADRREALWAQKEGVADLFYSWDAQIQDSLVVSSSQAAAYQLGRGLAETHWALYPDRDGTQMGSWGFLFGPQRQQTVRRLAARLSPYLGSLVIAAIDAPFTTWAALANDHQRRTKTSIRAKLYQQGLLWRDLVRGERQPLELSTPAAKDVWKQLAMYREAVDTLKVPLVVGTLAGILLLAGGAVLASGSGKSWLGTAIAILGALGLTSAGLYARAKSELTSLLANLREQMQVEQVQQAATLCPSADER